MNITTKESNRVPVYTGPTVCQIIGFNLTNEEIEKLTEGQIKRKAELEITGTSQNNLRSAKLEFLLKRPADEHVPVNLYAIADFRLLDSQVGQSGAYWVNGVAQYRYSNDATTGEEVVKEAANVLNKNKSENQKTKEAFFFLNRKPFDKAYVGESRLASFITKAVRMNPEFPEASFFPQKDLGLADLFDGNTSKIEETLKEINFINLDDPFTVGCFLTAYPYKDNFIQGVHTRHDDAFFEAGLSPSKWFREDKAPEVNSSSNFVKHDPTMDIVANDTKDVSAFF